MSNILVVEDDLSTRTNIEQLLKRSGYRVMTADSGEAGFLSAVENKPDLIISDIMMQGMDGYELLRKLLDEPQTQEIPLIFLSAKTDIYDINRGRNAGADDYVTKPYRAKDLLASVERQLNRTKFSNIQVRVI